MNTWNWTEGIPERHEQVPLCLLPWLQRQNTSSPYAPTLFPQEYDFKVSETLYESVTF